MITPESARAELARRELARRELARRESSKELEPEQPKEPAYGGGEGAKRFAFGGAPGFALGPGAEDVLPAAGQTFGGRFGPTAVAGAAAGELARQGIKAARGDTSGIEQPLKFGMGAIGIPQAVPSVGREAVTAGTVEGVMRGVPRVLFHKQFGGKAREVAGKKIGELIGKVKERAPFANVPKNPIVGQIDDAFSANKFERGPEIQALSQVKKKLLGLKQPLTFDEAIQLERQLGREAKFATDVTQGRFVKSPKAPGLNKAIKGIRGKLSDSVDDVAAKAGVPEFKEASRKFADLARKYPESDLQNASVGGELTRFGTFGGLASAPALFGAGPISAALSPAVFWATLPQRYKTAIFRKAIDTPWGRNIGRSATLLASEGLRRGTQP